jgi:hypothetical protein
MSHDAQSSPRVGFLAAWDRLVGARWSPVMPRRRGRKPRVPLAELMPALTYHVMQGAGTLAEHSATLFADTLADSSWADRRARLPWEIFADLMRRVLRPQATRRHREAFWRGWRLVALDGTTFRLTNTPQMPGSIRKARTRRGLAAFATMTTAVLLEVGLHNPLAAAIGRAGESEWVLGQRLLAQLPTRALLLGDRLYGVAAFARHARAACARVGSHFLLRASRSTHPRVRQRLRDGTRLIAVAVRSRQRPATILEWLEVREIRVRVGRRGHRTHELRLWTSLFDPRARIGAALCAAVGARIVFSRAETPGASDGRVAEPHRGHGRAGNRRVGPGQRRVGDGAGARRGWPPARVAHQFFEALGTVRQADVVLSGRRPRRAHRAANPDDHASELCARADLRGRPAPRAQLSTRRPPTDPSVAPHAEPVVHVWRDGVSARMTSAFSERH